MAYIEVIKDGTIIQRQRVDDARAKAGCVISLGTAGKVCVKLGQTSRVGGYEVRVVEDTFAGRAGDGDASRPSSAAAPRLEGYEIQSRLGEGGMGVVWKGIQLSTKRPVAIKFLSSRSFSSDRAQRRFEREVELCARLEHPAIARIYDSGLRHGAHYYAMELIDGTPLDQYVKDNALEPRQILVLIQTVCQAVQHAHQRGVIHRDLKPSNILVDAQGQPHVLDFGLAKELLGGDSGEIDLSIEGEAAGTPAYMSPEQAAGRHDATDTRTDVYSLGVILYRLLTGQPPHDLSGMRYDVIKRIVEQEVRRPREANPRMDGELEAVLLKSLSHDPERRYATAGDLAEDIHNYLGGEPLTARPATMTYFLRKRISKYRLPVGIAAVIVAFVLGLVVFSYARVTAEKNKAQAAAAAEAAAKGEAVKQRAAAEIRLVDALCAKAEAQSASGQGTAARQSFSEARQRADKLSLSTESIDLSLLECENRNPSPIATYQKGPGSLTVALGPDDRTMLTIAPGRKSLWLWNVLTGVTTGTLDGATGEIGTAVFSPSGKLIAATAKGGQVLVWSRSGGMPFPPLTLDDPRIRCLAFSPDESRLAVGGERHRILLIDLATGSLVSTFASHPGFAMGLAFTPNGKTIVSFGGPNASTGAQNITTWDATTGKELHLVATAETYSPAISRDGKLAAGVSWPGGVLVFDPESGAKVATATLNWEALKLAFFPDGKSLLAIMPNGSVFQIDAHTGNVTPRFTGLEKFVSNVGLSSGGDLLWQGDLRGNVAVWNLAEPLAFRPVKTAARLLTWGAARFSPGADFLSVGDDSTLNIIDCATGNPLRLIGKETFNGTKFAEILPDGHRIISSESDGALVLLDLAGGDHSYSIIDGEASIWGMAVSLDGRLAATRDLHNAQVIVLWDLVKGEFLRSLDYPAQPKVNDRGHLWFSPDGKTLLAGDLHQQHIWDVQTGRPLGQSTLNSLDAFNRFPGTAALADGRLAVVDTDGKIGVYAVPDAKPIWQRSDVPFLCLTAASTSKRLFTTSEDMSLRVWDAASGDLIHVFSGVSKLKSPAAVCDRTGAKLAVWDGEAFSLWDLKRMETQRDLESRARKAKEALRDKPDDAQSLAALGEYYSFRSAWPCAAELLEAARQHGAAVPPLTLARCYWQLGKPEAAIREFEAAIRQDAADPVYLRLCEEAVRNPPQAEPILDSPVLRALQPATAPATGPAEESPFVSIGGWPLPARFVPADLRQAALKLVGTWGADDSALVLARILLPLDEKDSTMLCELRCASWRGGFLADKPPRASVAWRRLSDFREACILVVSKTGYQTVAVNVPGSMRRKIIWMGNIRLTRYQGERPVAQGTARPPNGQSLAHQTATAPASGPPKEFSFVDAAGKPLAAGILPADLRQAALDLVKTWGSADNALVLARIFLPPDEQDPAMLCQLRGPSWYGGWLTEEPPQANFVWRRMSDPRNACTLEVAKMGYKMATLDVPGDMQRRIIWMGDIRLVRYQGKPLVVQGAVRLPNGQPLEAPGEVSIRVNGTAAKVRVPLTKGRFAFRDIAPGQYLVDFSIEGYAVETWWATVSEQEAAEGKVIAYALSTLDIDLHVEGAVRHESFKCAAARTIAILDIAPKEQLQLDQHSSVFHFHSHTRKLVHLPGPFKDLKEVAARIAQQHLSPDFSWIGPVADGDLIVLVEDKPDGGFDVYAVAEIAKVHNPPSTQRADAP